MEGLRIIFSDSQVGLHSRPSVSSVIVAGAGAAAGELPGAAGVLHVHLRVPVDPGAGHRRHAPGHGLQLLHGEHHLNSDGP